MNEAIHDGALIRALRSSHYPGAADDSVFMVIEYCRAMKIDPMLKPVHIVPMEVSVKGGGSEWRDVVMPGIGMYRIIAARSGVYMGKSAPEFGPVREYDIKGDKVQAPEWCSITVRKLVAGQICEFQVCEYFVENYGTKKGGFINAMWRRRTMGQLAKCAEAQALRAAFPDSVPAGPTIEERAIDPEEEIVVDAARRERFREKFAGVIEHQTDPQADLIAAQLRAVERAGAEREAVEVKPTLPEEPRRASTGGPTLEEIRDQVTRIASTEDANEALDVIRSSDMDPETRTEFLRSVNVRMRALKESPK